MAVTTEQNQLSPWLIAPAVRLGVEHYFRFLQRQAEINRQVALSWATAVAVVAPIPGAVLARALSVENPVIGQTHRVAEGATELMTTDPAGKGERADGRDLRINELFDDIVDGLIDADIRAATQL
jgi:hypothetical protein